MRPHYSGVGVTHEFYDAAFPQFPLALSPDEVYDVVRTEVVAEPVQVVANEVVRDCTFRHYIVRSETGRRWR